MNNFSRRLEVTANIAIIIVAITIVVVFAKKYLFVNKVNQPIGIVAGTKVSLPDVDWAKNGRTLLLVLQKGCHFCSESAPFYQHLVRETIGCANIHLVAVSPQEVAEGKKYLNDLGVQIEDVKQASLSALGVNGTPTLILVDGAGKVNNSWVGKLPANGESQVFGALQCNSPKASN
jgi:thioredoxin-related protein